MIFDKYESTGNDFLITSIKEIEGEGIEFLPEDISELAKKVCDRNFGIGADGLIVLGEAGKNIDGFGVYKKGVDSNCRMYLINSDGSQAEMSGNGMRCFAAYSLDHGFFNENGEKKEVIAETRAGAKTVLLNETDGTFFGEVDMGRVLNRSSDVPVVTENSLDVDAKLLGKQRRGIAVNSGVPHWVVLVDSIEELESEELAQEALDLRFDSRFSKQTNVSVAYVHSKSKIQARVFERGADETLSCGTGATAIAGALHEIGLCNGEIEVSLRGGVLNVRLTDKGSWLLDGPVRKIARCEYF